MSNQPKKLKDGGNEDIIFPEEFKSIISDSEILKEHKQTLLKAILDVSVHKSSSFSGPIPPPEILKGYGEAINSGAERIVAMAEKQSDHRIQLENHAIREELKQSRLGQIFGFILGLVGMGLASALAMFGHETIAAIFGTTTIIGLVTVFVLGKKLQQKNLSKKK